jgi:nickel transport protein
MKPVFWAVVLAACAFPADLKAHGVEASNISAGASKAAQTLRFNYTTGDPMMYATVKLYPPSAPDREILQSITDRQGVFSFMPDETGEWRISAEDGMGHKGEIMVSAADPAETSSPAAAPAPGKPPLAVSALLGVSLTGNVFTLLFIAAARRKGKSHAH